MSGFNGVECGCSCSFGWRELSEKRVVGDIGQDGPVRASNRPVENLWVHHRFSHHLKQCSMTQRVFQETHRFSGAFRIVMVYSVIGSPSFVVELWNFNVANGEEEEEEDGKWCVSVVIFGRT